MTRDHGHAGTHTASGPGAQTSGAPATYSIRQLVAYERLIERRERVDPTLAVVEYARANPDIDLDARSTFADWRGGLLPGDTAERPRGLYR